jgi:acetolactate synthase-1/2/3 large subunit
LTAHGRRSRFAGQFAEWHEHCVALKQAHSMNYDRNSALIQPYYVIEEINRLTRGEAIIATGVGQHQMWAAQYFDFRSPRLWLTSGSMGTMGFITPWGDYNVRLQDQGNCMNYVKPDRILRRKSLSHPARRRLF